MHFKKIITIFGILMCLGLGGCKNGDSMFYFIANQGTEVESIDVKPGTPFEIPKEPTRIGYTFEGWYTDKALTKLYTFPKIMPKKGVILFAKWTVKKSTITYNTNGGSIHDSFTDDYNSYVFTPIPKKEGFEFGGWYIDLDYTIEFNKIMPEKDTTLYAKWLYYNEETKINLNTNWKSSVANSYTITTSEGKNVITANSSKGAWDYVYVNVPQSIAKYSRYVITFSGTNSKNMMIKTEGTGVTVLEKTLNLSSETTTYVLITEKNNIGENKSIKFIIFLNPNVVGSGVSATIDSLYLYEMNVG